MDNNFDYDDMFDSDFDNVFGDTKANIFGGKNFYDDDVCVGYSRENIFGGEDYFDDDNQFVARSMDNNIGGMSLWSRQGYEGTIDFNDVGDDIFYGADGEITHFDFDTVGNGVQIMQYDDPLVHVMHYVMPDLIL